MLAKHREHFSPSFSLSFSLSLPPLRHLLFCCCKVGCCDQANAAVCQFQLRPPLNCADSSQGRNRGGNIPTVNHLRFFCLAFSLASNFNLHHSKVHCRKVKGVRRCTFSYKRGFSLCRHIAFSLHSCYLVCKETKILLLTIYRYHTSFWLILEIFFIGFF